MSDAITRYLRDLKHRGMTQSTIENHEWMYRSIQRELGKPLEEADDEELLTLLEGRGYKPGMERLCRNRLNQFMAFMDRPVKLPLLKLPRRLPVQPSDLVSPDDVRALIEAADHPRDKALIAVTYESAARAREIIGLRYRDITFEPTHARIRVVGKTGERIIPLVESVPYLQQYLYYAGPYEPDDRIWRSKKIHDQSPIGYHNFYLILKRLALTVLGRHIHPHILRHSRATYLVKHPEISTSVICEIAGWTQGTSMMKTYIHLAGADVENAVLSMHGIKSLEGDEDRPLKPITCQRCNHVNPADARFCAHCSLILDGDETIGEIQEAEQLVEEVLKALMANPDLMRQLKDRIQQG